MFRPELGELNYQVALTSVELRADNMCIKFNRPKDKEIEVWLNSEKDYTTMAVETQISGSFHILGKDENWGEDLIISVIPRMDIAHKPACVSWADVCSNTKWLYIHFYDPENWTILINGEPSDYLQDINP